MKSSKLVKVVLIMLISFIMMVMANIVFAADIDITPPNINNAISSGTGNTEANKNNVVANNTVKNNTTVNNSILKTNNTSTYNNSALPNTGIEDALPVTVLVVVFGISAVYAYKKIQDYKNI